MSCEACLDMLRGSKLDQEQSMLVSLHMAEHKVTKCN